jgi:hypothetical protein
MQAQLIETTLEEIRRTAADPVLVQVRAELAAFSAEAFQSAGLLLGRAGQLIGPDRATGSSPFSNGSDETVGVGLLLRIASQLITGSAALFASGHCYAAAALLRQLVEVEYLVWAFETRDKNAELWLRCSKSERENFFSPRKIRAAANGKFRSQDYGHHCELGGHPTPRAISLLNDDGAIRELLTSDLLHHVRGIWIHIMYWVKNAQLDSLVTRQNDAMSERFSHWASLDSLDRLPPAP